jgi:hypothetical protein
MPTRTETPKRISPSERKNNVALNSIKVYLMENFPLQEGESRVDFKPVGGNNFRINFWSKTKDWPWSEYNIVRSHYVICEVINRNWTHKIL